MLTRFAPAPTGFLHLGHVVNAIYVWGLARAFGAEVLLRIEDHDRQRSRPAFEAAILDDLDWLGFEADRFPTSAFRAGACRSRQSDRDALYRSVVDSLASRGIVYGCACSRQEIVRARDGAPNAPGYPGTCRNRNLGLGETLAWRVRLEETGEPWRDLLAGTEHRLEAGLSDPVIRDRHGNWTYQFAVVVDDWTQGVDLVIRGADLASSTSLQIALGTLVGRLNPARFAHHPLVMRTATEKLSKSDGDTGIGDLRRTGWTAERVIGHAAGLVGLTPDERPLWAGDVGRLFADGAMGGLVR